MGLLAALGSASIPLAVVACLASVAVAPVRSQPVVYVTTSLDRTSQKEGPPENAPLAMEISAAANEFEGAQLVIRGGENGLTGVDATLSGILETGDGRAIESKHVRFYREHYVNVVSPTEGKGVSGSYPDALIPFRNPFTGEPMGSATYPSAPFDVKPSENQPVYVEFYVPPGTRAGIYSGNIRVTHGGGTVLADVPVSLRVWNFELPQAFKLHTNFQSYDSTYSLGAAKYMGYSAGSAENKALAKAIDELLIEHRLTPENPGDASFGTGSDGSIRIGPERAAKILSLVKRPEYTDLLLSFGNGFPFPSPTDADRARAINYLRSAYAWFQSHGVAEKVFLRPGDEPSTVSEFATIRDLAALARSAVPEIKVAMTVVLGDARVEQYLAGAINRLIAGYWDFDARQAATHLAAGDEIWTYTALVQNESKPSPYWQIDFPLLNYRIVSWINFRYGATGILYWTSAYWNQMAARQASPWADPCNYRLGTTCYNGEGMLVYPGREVDFVVPRQAFGPYTDTAVYGAVPSLRLKALRDAVEDYEYLSLAAAVNPAAAQRESIKVACAGDDSADCFHHWSQVPGSLLRARSRLAALIESRVQRGVGSPIRGREQVLPNSTRQ